MGEDNILKCYNDLNANQKERFCSHFNLLCNEDIDKISTKEQLEYVEFLLNEELV